jgi:hypothetical protein
MLEKLKKLPLNTILMIVIVVLALLYLKQCNRSSNLNSDLKIANMNQLVLNDSITTYKDKAGDLTYQKGILIASEKELKDLNKELYNEVKDLKGNPKIVIQERIRIKEVPFAVPTYITQYPDGYTGLNWRRDTTYSAGNYQYLSGETKFIYDSLGIRNPTTFINTNEIGISFITGIKEGKDHYEIFIKSDYPGFTVTDIQGSILDKKMVTTNESSVVFGPSIGYGVVFNPSGNISHGVTVGVTATFNLNKYIKKLFKPYRL